jgi:hypothetical protein
MSTSSARGRTHLESQSAAVSMLAACAPHRDVIKAALDLVTRSPTFRSSKRAQEFLRYVVDHALAGEFDHLKERSIGSVVFGREADYDTGTDAIVRVTASDVRKRLTQYYQQAETGETVFFDLPSGSYIPGIRIELPTSTPYPANQQVVLERIPFKADWRVAAICGWAVAAVAIALWVQTRFGGSPSSLSHAAQTLPWVALLDGGQSPRLVMADSGMGSLRIFQPFSVSLEDYANRRFLKPAPNLQDDFQAPWRELAERQLTSVANARIAAGFAQLARSIGRRPVISFARDLQLGDFHRGDNLILLGSDSANPWVQLFQNQLNFQVHFDPALSRQSIHLQQPVPGIPPDLPASVTTGTTGQAYATIALINGLDGRGTVLILQGTNMEGTDLVGEMALSSDSLLKGLTEHGIDPSDATARFEVLFRLSATAGSRLASDVLATRIISKR